MEDNRRRSMSYQTRQASPPTVVHQRSARSYCHKSPAWYGFLHHGAEPQFIFSCLVQKINYLKNWLWSLTSHFALCIPLHKLHNVRSVISPPEPAKTKKINKKVYMYNYIPITGIYCYLLHSVSPLLESTTIKSSYTRPTALKGCCGRISSQMPIRQGELCLPWGSL